MSDNKIMPWIDELEGAAATDFPARRDEIAAMMAEAAELVCKAEELRGKAYFAGCSLEGQAKGHWSMEAVEQAKRRAGLVKFVWVATVLVWPILKWVLSIATFFQFVRMLYHWNTPGVYAGWSFLAYFAVLTAITYFVSIYKPKGL
jgi:hypothetical protein